MKWNEDEYLLVSDLLHYKKGYLLNTHHKEYCSIMPMCYNSSLFRLVSYTKNQITVIYIKTIICIG